jgi:lipopolysaccharide/colanic/teichoic acid biosynthesis glycosyltransferase
VLNRVMAAVALAALSPVVAVVAVLVRACNGSPVVFAHERAGRAGKPFRVLKFRTMRDPKAPGEPDETRITRLGRVLRASSLDELPSLWNVVRGEMNLVGPRPLPMAYNAAYSALEARRLEVKPGLTGPVQVNGRNALTWDEKFALDVWYVEHRSWRVDLRLLAETPLAVVRARGISHPGHATMPEFKGRPGAPSVDRGPGGLAG